MIEYQVCLQFTSFKKPIEQSFHILDFVQVIIEFIYRCALNIVAQVKKACDSDLSKIKSCIKLTGFVNSTDDYIEQPKVINGASDTIAKIFDDNGMHARAAVSTNSLPLGVAVEVDAIFELN